MPVVTLILAAGAAWESQALALLDRHRDVVVLKRCVDVEDLLAAASSGQADAVVLGADAPGLDSTVIDHLRHHGVQPVAVAPAGLQGEGARAQAVRVGLRRLVAEDELEQLADALAHPDQDTALPADPLEEYDVPAVSRPHSPGSPDGSDLAGRVLAVWGPAGSPGRSTLASALAAELADREEPVLLVDADPFGGSIAQQLGVLDEVSGLLAAARLAAAGELTERFTTVPRRIAPHLDLVTGLPRAERWSEIRAGLVEQLLEQGRRRGATIVDTGFCLEDDAGAELGGRPGRHHLTLSVLEQAEEIIAVGAADPVGLTRLARGLVELGDRFPEASRRVVVNRMRGSLGWTEREIVEMLSVVAGPVEVHLLPEDRPATDRALVSGRTLVESAPDSPLARAVAGLADSLAPASARPGSRRTGSLRRRRAGTARPR